MPLSRRALAAAAVVAVAVIAKRGRGTAIAFGPFLALGAAVAVFWGDALLNAYLSTL